jgi:hypothetical protein
MPIEFCREKIKNWKKILKVDGKICVAGSMLLIDDDFPRKYFWAQSCIWSKNGSDEYFNGDCKVKDLVKWED